MPDPTETLPGPVTVEQLLLRSMKDAAEQRDKMSAAVGRLADAMTEHNAGAATRNQQLLDALKTRDAGAVVVAQQLVGEAGAQRAWMRETFDRATLLAVIPSLILALGQLLPAVLTALPEPDPEIRKLRLAHRQRMVALHQQHTEELAAARLGRRT